MDRAQNTLRLSNTFMSLVIESQGGGDLAEDDKAYLIHLWRDCMSASGREYFEIWAEDNDLTLPPWLYQNN